MLLGGLALDGRDVSGQGLTNIEITVRAEGGIREAFLMPLIRWEDFEEIRDADPDSARQILNNHSIGPVGDGETKDVAALEGTNMIYWVCDDGGQFRPIYVERTRPVTETISCP